MPIDAIASNLLTNVPAATGPVVTPFDDIEMVVVNHQKRIFRFLFASVRDADLAQTLTQETFLRVWNTRHAFRGECSVSTWLTRIALNLLRDHTRTGRFRFWRRATASAVDATEIAPFLPSNESPLESRLIASEQMSMIWKTVDSLSPRQRSVFLLRFVEDMELTEIAAATGIPLSTVKSHLYRALATVRARHAKSSLESL
ncbi:MAG: sigma-70 family RNA polymerase sigma factor [Edaphobacter sp.]|uniref:RNA polymerase sigma factor n=1 Tax=Edaphobacter sp. TaxID=1934404 RepID=UPI0023A5CD7F|nr:sigma-70 family RNA polymerase sigma factor [Edaphobacter sp.]MDE1177841.1 sigma-70 family RNA polymerase sigma factor [Edaphobacter sp.]